VVFDAKWHVLRDIKRAEEVMGGGGVTAEPQANEAGLGAQR
jgi:hypothetical protein